MELAFADKQLRQICESTIVAQRKLGVTKAASLRRRLADFRAVDCVGDIMTGNPREVLGSDPPSYAVTICNGSIIVFCANHNTNPLLVSGSIDWSKVSRIKILEIQN